MAKSFDDLANRVMTKEARAEAHAKAMEMLVEIYLGELRKHRNLSQAEVARRMGIKQPTLSKLESHRQDIQVGTLNRIVSAMGAELRITARLPGGEEFSLLGRRKPGPDAMPGIAVPVLTTRAAVSGAARFRGTTKGRANRKAAAAGR